MEEEQVANKRYSVELKEQVVKEYLSGTGMMELVRKYELADKSRVRKWVEKYRVYGGFEDGRGKSQGGGRPKKANPCDMTQEAYIQYLEMENAVLKQLRSLSSSQPSGSIK